MIISSIRNTEFLNERRALRTFLDNLANDNPCYWRRAENFSTVNALPCSLDAPEAPGDLRTHRSRVLFIMCAVLEGWPEAPARVVGLSRRRGPAAGLLDFRQQGAEAGGGCSLQTAWHTPLQTPGTSSQAVLLPPPLGMTANSMQQPAAEAAEVQLSSYRASQAVGSQNVLNFS